MTDITPFRKAIAGSLAVLTLATGIVALSSASASAQWRGGWGPGPGAGFAAGVVGGLAAGALAAGAYGPYYYAQPAYPYPYAGCYFAPQRVWNGYRWVIRRVEVCN